MNNLMDLYEENQKKLNRNLVESEKEFLKWVYGRYEEELNEEEPIKNNTL